jgi:hypothetical protein
MLQTRATSSFIPPARLLPATHKKELAAGLRHGYGSFAAKLWFRPQINQHANVVMESVARFPVEEQTANPQAAIIQTRLH